MSCSEHGNNAVDWKKCGECEALRDVPPNGMQSLQPTVNLKLMLRAVVKYLV